MADPAQRTLLADVEDLLPEFGLADVMRARPAGIGSLAHAVRIALAVTVSWLVAGTISHSALALFAPVTTLLVVQSSPWTTLGVSVQRTLGTGLGVLLASVYVNVVGLTWWSFLVGVLVSLLVARLLPWSIGGQLQIPVAVVFVLALGPGSAEQDAWRDLDVLIGGIVGLAAVFVLPTRPRPEPFEAALRRYRDAIVDLTQRLGAESGRQPVPLPAGTTHDYVYASRRLRDVATQARDELDRLGQAAALNLRAGTVPAALAARALRLRRLSGVGLQVRGLVGVANSLYDRADVEPTLSASTFAALVDDLGRLMRAALGDPDSDREVGPADATAVDAASERLGAAIQAAAVEVSRRQDQVGQMLDSVSILGRIEQLRRQLAAFPRQPGATVVDEGGGADVR